jgi:hypothetical protein
VKAIQKPIAPMMLASPSSNFFVAGDAGARCQDRLLVAVGDVAGHAAAAAERHPSGDGDDVAVDRAADRDVAVGDDDAAGRLAAVDEHRAGEHDPVLLVGLALRGRACRRQQPAEQDHRDEEVAPHVRAQPTTQVRRHGKISGAAALAPVHQIPARPAGVVAVRRDRSRMRDTGW